jgi:hypothetical protein
MKQNPVTLRDVLVSSVLTFLPFYELATKIAKKYEFDPFPESSVT